MELYFKIFGPLKSTPYKWNISKETIEISQSIIQQGIFILTGIHLIFVSVYLLISLLTESKKYVLDYPSVLLLSIWLVYYIWSGTSFLNAFLKKKDITTLFTHLVEIQRKYEVEFKLIQKPVIGRFGFLELYMFSIIYILISYLISTTLMFIMIPHKPQYIYSMVPENHRSFPIFCIFLLYEMYSKLGTAMLLLIDTVNLILTSLTSKLFLQLIKKLKVGRMKKMQEFRKIQILMQYYNTSNTWILLPVTVISLTLGFLLFSLGAIRLHGRIYLIEYLIFPVCASGIIFVLSLVFYVPAFVHKSSEKLYDSMLNIEMKNSKSSVKLFDKEIRSLKPFGIQVGMLLCVKKLSLFFLYMLLSNYFVSLLVAFPSTI